MRVNIYSKEDVSQTTNLTALRIEPIVADETAADSSPNQ